MGLDPEQADLEVRDEDAEPGTVCLHAYSDLTYVSPLVFLYLLKECYKYGSLNADRKLKALKNRVRQVLANNPKPGPATFIVKCLIVLPMFGVSGEGFSQLVISALSRFFKSVSEPTSEDDMSSARKLAAQFFLDTVGGSVSYDEKVMLDTLKVFDVGLSSIDEALSVSDVFASGSAFLEHYIPGFFKLKSYMTSLIKE